MIDKNKVTDNKYLEIEKKFLIYSKSKMN